MALVALVWSLLATRVGERWGSAPTPEPPEPAAPARSTRRLDAPTRMALQMAVGLSVALAVGHLLLGREWPWAVLSAYLVATGNRGRGDVVHKAGLRVLGGAAGTVVATLVGGLLPHGHPVLLGLLLMVMFASLVLRERSYAWWAAGVTAMLALLHQLYGETGGHVLVHRLLGVLLGSAIGVAAAWWVTPVRTADVVRRRLADALAALTDDLAPDATTETFPGALARLDQLGPTLRAHHRTFGRRDEAHPRLAVAALHDLLPLPAGVDERQRLRRDVILVRRSIVGRADPDPEQLVAQLAVVHGHLQSTR